MKILSFLLSFFLPFLFLPPSSDHPLNRIVLGRSYVFWVPFFRTFVGEEPEMSRRKREETKVRKPQRFRLPSLPAIDSDQRRFPRPAPVTLFFNL
ncbi:proline-rich receptor-like protein kinase PERK13-like protein [Corchorus olitorius]|uniref:Proline-rich receptor-like protein kinase PERK13-like protein n=1 Tax=Corchorus olitorius TaxID=93759 RepID=A0A1R3J3F5_9ROSI|nr:proline-rich receptor-like protein kinase PERK13-like protein [Corchorus olitorius]